jgi:hypothetical protein
MDFVFQPTFAFHPRNIPLWLSTLGNFDGIHYMDIASKGYDQNQQAFFPLYPLLINLLTRLGLSFFFAGILISNLSLILFIYFFSKFLKQINFRNRYYFFLILLSYPFSFFLNTIYTESLFLFLFALYLYSLTKKNYSVSFISAFLLATTRVNGIFIIIPAVLFLRKPLIISPLLGLLSYCAYLLISTGDPLAFFHSQANFGAARSTSLIFLPQVYWRYFKIFATAAPNFTYFVSVTEFICITFGLIILFLDLKKNYKNKFLLSLNLFSFANLLLPTLTGTFLSTPRFLLLAPSVFLYLANAKNTIKIPTILVFCLFKILYFYLFLQGYFVA